MPPIPPLTDTYVDPLGRFVLPIPEGWQTIPAGPMAPEVGVYVMDGSEPYSAPRWVQLLAYALEEGKTSLEEAATRGLWPGEITDLGKSMLGDREIIRRPVTGPPHYHVIWMLWGKEALAGSAWPGQDPAMIALLEAMLTGMREP